MGAVRQLSYFTMGLESEWGTDVTPTDGFPFDDYSVEASNVVREIDKFTGEVDTVYLDTRDQDVAGGMTCQVWPFDVQLTPLFQLAGIPLTSVGPTDPYGAGTAVYAPESMTVYAYDLPNDEAISHTGLMCNSVTISASGDDPDLKFAFDLIGQAETVISTPAKPTMPAVLSYSIHDATFTIDESEESNVLGFEITINNNLVPATRRNSNGQILWLDSGKRSVELSYTIRAHSADGTKVYRVNNRARKPDGIFVVSFDYPGSSSGDIETVALTIAEYAYSGAPLDGGVGDVEGITVSGTAASASVSNHAIEYATT